MTERQHSPGPWTVCSAHEGQCQCGIIWAGDRMHYVATATKEDEDMFTLQEETFQANKRLIAAAPDLMHVVDELLAAFKKGIRSLETHEEEALYDLAHQAREHATSMAPIPEEPDGLNALLGNGIEPPEKDA